MVFDGLRQFCRRPSRCDATAVLSDIDFKVDGKRGDALFFCSLFKGFVHRGCSLCTVDADNKFTAKVKAAAMQANKPLKFRQAHDLVGNKNVSNALSGKSLGLGNLLAANADRTSGKLLLGQGRALMAFCMGAKL